MLIGRHFASSPDLPACSAQRQTFKDPQQSVLCCRALSPEGDLLLTFNGLFALNAALRLSNYLINFAIYSSLYLAGSEALTTAYVSLLILPQQGKSCKPLCPQ
jgi:hypothetical protein